MARQANLGLLGALAEIALGARGYGPRAKVPPPMSHAEFEQTFLLSVTPDGWKSSQVEFRGLSSKGTRYQTLIGKRELTRVDPSAEGFASASRDFLEVLLAGDIHFWKVGCSDGLVHSHAQEVLGDHVANSRIRILFADSTIAIESDISDIPGRVDTRRPGVQLFSSNLCIDVHLSIIEPLGPFVAPY